MTLTVREIDRRHLADVARVHVASFPDSAISRFGLESASRYYATQLDHNQLSVFVGAWRGDQLVGFACGGPIADPFRIFIADHWPFLLRRALRRPAAVIDRRVIGGAARIARAFAQQVLGRRRDHASSLGSTAPSAVRQAREFGLLAIAVDPAMHRTGAGGRLLAAIQEHAGNENYAEMTLHVRPDNEVAIRFYEHRGWVRAVFIGRWDGKMTKSLRHSP